MTLIRRALHASVVLLLLLLLLVSSTPVFAAHWPRRHDPLILQHAHPLRDALDDSQLAPALTLLQKLDHDDHVAITSFAQRYFLNDSLYVDRANQPLLLEIGGEGAASARCVGPASGLAWYAQQMGGALLACLEHRYYGQSLPTQSDALNNVTTLQRLLTSQQAAEDLVWFVQFLRQTGVIEQQTPVILVGGSYAGALSAWTKSKHGDVFLGAHAASAPVVATYDFYQYLWTVQDALGPVCSGILRDATQLFESLVRSPATRPYVAQLFNTCSPLENDKDIALLVNSMLGPWAALVQYNTNYRALNITSACAIMSNFTKLAPPSNSSAPSNDTSTNALVALAMFNQFYNTAENSSYPFAAGAQCLDTNYTHFITSTLSTPGADRYWTLQCCNEFAFWQTSEDMDKQPFSQRNSLSFLQGVCADVFGITNTESLVNSTLDYYGGLRLQTNQTILTNGRIDPWHTLGINEPNSLVGSNNSVVLIAQASHCQDLSAPRDSDTPLLNAARASVLDNMLVWLGLPPRMPQSSSSSSTGSMSSSSSLFVSSSSSSSTNGTDPNSTEAAGLSFLSIISILLSLVVVLALGLYFAARFFKKPAPRGQSLLDEERQHSTDLM